MKQNIDEYIQQKILEIDYLKELKKEFSNLEIKTDEESIYCEKPILTSSSADKMNDFIPNFVNMFSPSLEEYCFLINLMCSVDDLENKYSGFIHYTEQIRIFVLSNDVITEIFDFKNELIDLNVNKQLIDKIIMEVLSLIKDYNISCRIPDFLKTLMVFQ